MSHHHHHKHGAIRYGAEHRADLLRQRTELAGKETQLQKVGRWLLRCYLFGAVAIAIAFFWFAGFCMGQITR